jgi:hypothetical protein
MSPRQGGMSDKSGNRYEFAWTVMHLLEVLAGRATSVKLEEVGELGRGVEFVCARSPGRIEAHQVKRQRGSAHNWSLRALRGEKVLATAATQVAGGRDFSFVSMVPATELRELSERARGADTLAEFVAGLNEGHAKNFDLLADAWDTPDTAWQTLRGVHAVVIDERELDSRNAVMASLLIQGADGTSAAASLRQLAERNLGVTLDADTLWSQLQAYGLGRATLLGAEPIAEAVRSASARWQHSIERELLRPRIPRREAEEIVAAFRDGHDRVLLAAGAAGIGKSAVLEQAVAAVRNDGWPVLGLRLDRLEPFTTTLQLGTQLDLATSPVSALAASAGNGPALLVVDQLDAVSFASGRMPASFDAIDELLRETAAFPEMRVLLACRQFDIDNDDRLRGLVSESGPARSVAIGPLDDEAVDNALAAMGFPDAHLTRGQRTLLATPLHLVLLSAVADDPRALEFATAKDLFDRFWERKRRDVSRRRDPSPRFSAVIATAVEAMSARQRLSIPPATLDADELLSDADVLISEHVLVRDGARIAFFHEAFFDYAFARQWMARKESVREFLLGGEQELFRRAQVRQVLLHLRDEEPERFVADTRELLRDDEVRFHIKDVVLALLRAIPDPSQAEWHLLDSLLSERPPFAERVWAVLRTPSWFTRLDAEGAIESWLGADDIERRGRALDVMRNAVSEHPTRIAEILAPHEEENPEFPRWLQHLALYAPIEKDETFFELVTRAAARGHFDGVSGDLWMIAHELGDQAPGRGCRLLHAYLAQRPAAFHIASQSRGIDELHEHAHGLDELIRKCADGAPQHFLQLMLPYMLEVMAKTAYGPDHRPTHDAHFTWRTWKGDIHQTDDALLVGARRALRKLAEEEPAEVEPFVDLLSADPHDGAQWLLYETLKAAPQHFANRAGEILLEGEHRLDCGYSDSPYWTTRELLQAVSPSLSNEHFASLEELALEFAPDGETTAGRGLSCFTLLGALDESRLSDRSRRRLGELRRRFNEEQPSEPFGMQAGWVAPPIPQKAAEKMNDEQWLRAITKHSESERPDDRDFLLGGADEQANVLAEATKEDPNRFAALALAFDRDTNLAYIDAVLRGVGQAKEPVDAERMFKLVRHAASLEIEDLDRWLGWSLRRVLDEEIPDDIIEIVLDRALNSPHPDSESWLEEAPSGGRYYSGDPFSFGINSGRGSSAEVLGDLLVRDTDGQRTELVVPSLPALATDSSVAVRSCVAHVVGGCLRHARPAANAAFALLIDTDDRLLATRPVERLIVYIGWDDPGLVVPTIRRMLASEYENVREAGGRLAAFAGLEFGEAGLLEDGLHSADPQVRKGVATVCAHRLPHAGDGEGAEVAVRSLIRDTDDEVRKEAAGVASALRGHALAPYAEVLLELIASPAFEDGLAQLLITLQRAPGRVDRLTFACAERFVEAHAGDAHSIASRAAADSKEVGELLLRSYATTTDSDARARALDLLDGLLAIGAYGVADLIAAAER